MLGRNVARAFPLALAALALLVAACAQSGAGTPTRLDQPAGTVPTFFPPPAASEQGRDISALYSLNFWIATAIFLLVEGLIIWCVLRYRRRSDRLPPQTHGHTIAEILWTVVPAILVMIVFVASTFTLYRVEAKANNPAVTVDAYGFQWQWQFGYDCPEDFSNPANFTPERMKECGVPLPAGVGDKGPEMVLPVGQQVHIRLHAVDVNHAFYVPYFLYKKDVIPGEPNSFVVNIEQPGTYSGQCAEFCGLAHASMTFTVRAVPPAEFATWKEQAKREADERARATQQPQPSPAPGAATLSVSASTPAAFDQTALEAAADAPITIQFKNNDPSAQHNVAVRGATPQGDYVPPVADPGQSATYNVPALQAGQYEFYCSVHPNMKGTLTVK